MNREHLSYVLGKLVCWLRREHSYGPKEKHAAGFWFKKCVICGHDIATDKPVRRVERRTKD
jgi:hypothetical protein